LLDALVMFTDEEAEQTAAREDARLIYQA